MRAQTKKAKRLSAKTMRWLHEWMWGSTYPAIPRSVLDEVAPYRPTTPVNVCRYAEDVKTEHKKYLRSFSYDRELVDFMLEVNETGKVYCDVFDPKNIVVDFTRLPGWEKGEFLNEVIVSRGDRELLASKRKP